MNSTNWDAAPFLEKVLGIVPGIIYVFNQKSQSNEYTNRSLGELLGYEASEVQEMGESLFPRICHPDDLPLVAAHFLAIQEMQDGEIKAIEYRMQHKQGHWVWLQSYDTVFERDEAGSVLKHIGVATDISVQKEAENKAQESQDKAEQATDEQRRISTLLKKIMDTTKSSIVALNADGMVLSVNSAGRYFLGNISEPVPFHWPAEIEFIDNETLQPIASERNPLGKALAGTSLDGEVFLVKRKGEEKSKYVRVSSSLVDDGKETAMCVMILDDVSEQERNRQHVERTSRLDALGQLTGGIAHDFNNLLATVQYALNLAQTASENARSTYIETAQQSVIRGSELTKRLLAFAKQQPGLSASHDVAEVINEFQKLCTPLIEASIRVDYKIYENDLWVICDNAQLENALLNLILNAKDAILQSGEGNQITVSVRLIKGHHSDAGLRTEQANAFISKEPYEASPVEGGRADSSVNTYVEFAVTDNGPGMTREVKRRAIDPFFSTKETNSGTGLGLSMVYGFIQQSNGELWIYSEPGQGTTIRLLLPRGTPSGTRETKPVRETLPRGQGEKILVVEDEIRLAILIRDLIKSLGYTVVTAAHGEDALSVLERMKDVRLVLTDIMMPGGLNGFELAEAIREKDKKIPIIYMSGYSAHSDGDMGAVMAPMLQKPCPLDELARAIHTALEEG